MVLWPCTWTGLRDGAGLLPGEGKEGDGTTLTARALSSRDLEGRFGVVVAYVGNLSTVCLPGQICRNDLSREELQQLLRSAFHPACARQRAAQPGTQVPAPEQPSSELARTARFTPVPVRNKWHWLQEVRVLGWERLGFSPSRGLQSLKEGKAVILAARMMIAKKLLLLAFSKAL